MLVMFSVVFWLCLFSLPLQWQGCPGDTRAQRMQEREKSEEVTKQMVEKLKFPFLQRGAMGRT